MSDPELIAYLRERLAQPLPGLPAQLLMSPLDRRSGMSRLKVPDDARQSAVLILLYPGDEGNWYLPIQVRNAYKGVHSRQISLPGGGREEFDLSFEANALREAEEELNIPARKVEVLGRLSPLYIPPSNYFVQPVVGFLPERPNFVLDPREVARMLEVPLADFMNIENEIPAIIQRPGAEPYEVPSFQIQEQTVWGATAMIMSEFRTILGEL